MCVLENEYTEKPTSLNKFSTMTFLMLAETFDFHWNHYEVFSIELSIVSYQFDSHSFD